MNIAIDDLASAITNELVNYSQEVTDGLKEDIKEAAKLCKDEIKKNAPRDRGEYAKSWKTQKVFENDEDIRIVVHSPKHYRLAHLLEYGHAKVGGGRVVGKPHLATAEKAAEKLLDKSVKITVRGGK